MRILQIEDDAAVARSIELMMKAAGFNIYTTDLGEEGVDLGKVYEYDLIILDLTLPDISGYDVLKQLRMARVNTPVMILSGNPDIEAKVKTLGYGADDYMTKPFNKDELIARATAIVRRSNGHAESVIRTGPFLLNLDAKTVEVDGNRVHLTGKEYQMFELLSLRKGTTLTKEMFLNHLYGGMDEPELKIIDVFICKLRKKLKNAAEKAALGMSLEEAFEKGYFTAEGEAFHGIETVWGRGYVGRDVKLPKTAVPGGTKPAENAPGVSAEFDIGANPPQLQANFKLEEGKQVMLGDSVVGLSGGGLDLFKALWKSPGGVVSKKDVAKISRIHGGGGDSALTSLTEGFSGLSPEGIKRHVPNLIEAYDGHLRINPAYLDLALAA